MDFYLDNFIKFFYEKDLNGDCRRIRKIIFTTSRPLIITRLSNCKKYNTIHHLFKFLKSHSQKEVIMNE